LLNGSLKRHQVAMPHLARASGLSEVTWNAASVLGPPLAAPLVLVFGLGWALAVNAGSFVVSYLTLRAIRSDASHDAMARRTKRDGAPLGRVRPAELLGDLRKGWAFVASNSVVRTVTFAFSWAMLGAGAYHALAYFFVTQTLHAAPALYGLVGPAFGGGSVVGALLAGRVVSRMGPAPAFAGSVVAVGCALMLLSRQTRLAPALVIWVGFGIVNAAANVATMPLLLGATPRALVGRMNAIFFSVIATVALCSSIL
jgi:Na+/melibiose symporter-like transporter